MSVLSRSLYVYYVSLDAVYADFSQMTGRRPQPMTSYLPHSVDFGIDIFIYYSIFVCYIYQQLEYQTNVCCVHITNIKINWQWSALY